MEELLTPGKGHNMRAKNNSAAALRALSCRSKGFPPAQLGKNESHSGREAWAVEAATRHLFLMLILFFCCGSSNSCVSIFHGLKKKDI